MKEQAKKKLNKYGLTLSSFTNLMLVKFLKDDLDLLLSNETEQVFEYFETSISFDKSLKEIK